MSKDKFTHQYDDIINLPRPVSLKHPRMSRADRAAQFGSFSALTGHAAAIKETARLTNQKIELDDEQERILNENLSQLQDQIAEHPQVTVTYFQPDEKKSGGAYVTITDTVKWIDEYERTVVLQNGKKISIGDIYEIRMIAY